MSVLRRLFSKEGSGKDPVCGMSVRPSSSELTLVYDGATYYFCSKSCKQEFEREPGKYAPGKAGQV